MTRDEMVERVLGILAERASRPPQTIDLSTRLAKDLQFDSLDKIRLALEFEEAFAIEITPEEMNGAVEGGDVTVAQVVDLLAGKRKDAAQPSN